MEIREAAKILEDKYMTYPDVFGVNVVNCKGCGGEYIEVYINTHNRQLMSSIPSQFKGFRIEKIHKTVPRYDNEALIVPAYSYPYLYTSIYGIPSYNIGYPRVIGGGFRPPRPRHIGVGHRGGRRR